MLQHVEADNHAEDLRIDVLQAACFVIKAWDEVKVETIHNCWHHVKILPPCTNEEADLRNILEDIYQSEDSMLNDLADDIQALNLSHPMKLEEFLNIPEENVIFEIPKDDQKLAYLFKNTDEENMDLEEMDDSCENPVINTSTAIASLETIRMFLLQQDNVEEYVKLVGKIEKFFKIKKTSSMRQTNIDTYFH